MATRESGVNPALILRTIRLASRGCYWFDPSGDLASSSRLNIIPTLRVNSLGFRVAAVPEPSVCVLTLAGICGFVLRRKHA